MHEYRREVSFGLVLGETGGSNFYCAEGATGDVLVIQRLGGMTGRCFSSDQSLGGSHVSQSQFSRDVADCINSGDIRPHFVIDDNGVTSQIYSWDIKGQLGSVGSKAGSDQDFFGMQYFFLAVAADFNFDFIFLDLHCRYAGRCFDGNVCVTEKYSGFN